MVTDIAVTPEGEGSRLVIRVSADAAGAMAVPGMAVFRIIDSMMAIRQLCGTRKRVERYGARTENPEEPETGARDQYQLYEVVYASGESAGVPGKEQAARWRETAREDGVIEGE
jgi:hypothetical protein